MTTEIARAPKTEWERRVPLRAHLVLHGAGNLYKHVVDYFGGTIPGCRIMAVCDNDSLKINQRICGVTIDTPAAAMALWGADAYILMLVHLGADDVRKQYEALGVPANRILSWWTLFQGFPGLHPMGWFDCSESPPDGWLDGWADDESVRVLRNARACQERYSDRSEPHAPEHDFSLPAAIYFDDTVYRPLADERFLDGGAFDGDTVAAFRAKYGVLNSCFILAVEPNAQNRAKLERRFPYVHVSTGALGSDPTLNSAFMVGQGPSARVVASGEDAEIATFATTIDTLCAGRRRTLIKLDIEGAELDALRGAVKTIQRDRPVLAVCLYHKPPDMWEIPAFLRGVCSDYRFYARCYSPVAECLDTVLYAVPEDRCL